jgi:ribosomal protein S18 acetylase RimI-like enzyme
VSDAPGPAGTEVRVAATADAADAARLLHDFNIEFGDDTPGPAALAERVARLLANGDTVVLLAGAGPDGVAVLRFRLSLWAAGLECYLAELYVAPAARGRGLGRALMTAVIAEARDRGADYIDLNTGEDDTVARALYESLGFTNTEGRPGGPANLYYELEL